MTVTMVTWSRNVTVTSVTWSSSMSEWCWESAQGTVCEHSIPSISARGTGTSVRLFRAGPRRLFWRFDHRECPGS